MSPFLCGKSTLTPDLPLLQRLPVIRLPSPGEMFLNNRLEITVLELSGAGLVRLIQTFLPQRTAAAVFLFRPVFPEQPAATSIQPLAPQFFPVRAQVYVPLFIIGECIPLQFSFRAVMGGLWHDKEVDAQFFQRSVCQGEVIGGVAAAACSGTTLLWTYSNCSK